MRHFRLTIVFLFAIAATSCKKQTENKTNFLGLTYFPVKVGKQAVYRVDSIVYDGFSGQIDTSSYLLMERMDTMIKDLENRDTYVIGRYVKQASDTAWKLTGYHRANRSNTTAERLESNVRYVKMSFPVKEGRQWEGNAYNTDVPQTYKYVSANVPRNFGLLRLDSTATVLQIDDVIEGLYKNYAEETFAAGIGLVSKRIETFDYQQAFSSGFKLTYTLVSHN